MVKSPIGNTARVHRPLPSMGCEGTFQERAVTLKTGENIFLDFAGAVRQRSGSAMQYQTKAHGRGLRRIRRGPGRRPPCPSETSPVSPLVRLDAQFQMPETSRRRHGPLPEAE